MPTTDTERLKALVEEMEQDQSVVSNGGMRYTITEVWRTKLAAIIAESEGEPCCRWMAERTTQPPTLPLGRPGCGRDHGGGSWNANCPDCERKAKLPLGHEFRDEARRRHTLMWPPLCALCGQPRSAHEPKS